MDRIFLLSPARASGKRAQLLLGQRARCQLAQRLRIEPGVALGEIFSFLSGLYFRGKLAYAQTFARPPAGLAGVWVITPNRGLMPAGQLVNLRELRNFSRVDIDATDRRYRRPLERDARRLASQLKADTQMILLGSISTGKYCEILSACFMERLFFPTEFIGRGDMSRGGLLLRCVAAAQELAYQPVDGAVRRGKRPPKLAPRSWKNSVPDPAPFQPVPTLQSTSSPCRR